MGHRQFNTGEPLAYFLTWTTYGTWLPGDNRWWKSKASGELKRPNPALENASRKRMAEPAFELTSEARILVAEVVKKHCEVRGWQLYVVNPRTNHVHVVVSAPGYDPKIVRQQFQAWCTRRLKERFPTRENFWTEGGCGQCVNTKDDLEQVIRYASEAQDDKDSTQD